MFSLIKKLFLFSLLAWFCLTSAPGRFKFSWKREFRISLCILLRSEINIFHWGWDFCSYLLLIDPCFLFLPASSIWFLFIKLLLLALCFVSHQACLDDFTHHNIDVACNLLETSGRFLYRSPETTIRMANMLEILMRLKNVKNLDPRHSTLVENAYYLCKPPERSARVTKVRPPLYQVWLISQVQTPHPLFPICFHIRRLIRPFVWFFFLGSILGNCYFQILIRPPLSISWDNFGNFRGVNVSHIF